MDNIKEEVKEQYKDSQMSKAGRLAMELNAERTRLKQEMEDLQHQVEDLSPVTSTGKSDEYVKWIATILAILGVFMMSADLIIQGQICYAVSSVCWVYVGASWNDKAIMIGSAITGTSVAMNITKYLFS